MAGAQSFFAPGCNTDAAQHGRQLHAVRLQLIAWIDHGCDAGSGIGPANGGDGGNASDTLNGNSATSLAGIGGNGGNGVNGGTGGTGGTGGEFAGGPGMDGTS